MNQGQLEGRLATIEARMAGLEAHNNIAHPKLDRMEDKLAGLTERIAKLEERVSHLPSKEMMWTVAGGTITVLTAVITFAGKIQQLFGTATIPH
ncbi:hypothetical protein [Bradyrhizobium ottawaense]|uniref:hypothetical protein n=1 Tax=Bradyrhizobium ottawaense TaxID=931866 RepID=UPI0030F3B5D5